MKIQVFLIMALLITASLFSQKWVHTIGLPNMSEEGRRVTEHYDKGYLITGLITPSEITHGLLIKTDINGNVLWDKIIGNITDQVLIAKTLYDGEGNLYIFGINDIDPQWPMVLKLNTCGELQWCRLLYFDEFMYGYLTDAILLDNGDLIALAYLADEDYSDQIFLFCISPEGEYKWKKSYASCSVYPDFKDRLGSRIQFFDDIYLISGYVYSPHPAYPTIVSIRPMFIGIDTLFNEKWVLQFGLEDNMKGKALTSIPINDSLFMGVGRYRYVGSSGETQDAWAMYYNENGEQTGYQLITTDKLGSEITQSVFFEVENVNDNIYLATSGYFYGEDDEIALGEIVFDTAGKVYNYSLREGTAGGNTSVIKTFDNKYTIACCYQYPDLSYDVYFYKVNDSLEQDTVYPGNYTYDSLCPYQIQSGIIDLTGCTVITDIKDVPWKENYNKCKDKLEILSYPNPANDGQITLEFKNIERHQNIELKCFTVYGKLMFAQEVKPSQRQAIVDIESWPSGVYLINLFENQKLIVSGKFIKK
jgi:hypothetical protein